MCTWSRVPFRTALRAAAGNAFHERYAQQSAQPDNRLSIRQAEIRAQDVLAETRIAVRLREKIHVRRRKYELVPIFDGGEDSVSGLFEAERIEWKTQQPVDGCHSWENLCRKREPKRLRA